MTDIKKIQDFNCEKIIMACNPKAKSYEEALEVELNSPYVDCCVMIKNNRFPSLSTEVVHFINDIDKTFVNIRGEKYKLSSIKKIRGKPLTLDRVLIALEAKGMFYISVNGHLIKRVRDCFNYFDYKDLNVKWDLTKPTLEEQTEETQLAIAKLLGFNN